MANPFLGPCVRGCGRFRADTAHVTIVPFGQPTACPPTCSFTVDTTADTNDFIPGNGSCADSNGDCSVRAACEAADAFRPERPSRSPCCGHVPADVGHHADTHHRQHGHDHRAAFSGKLKNCHWGGPHRHNLLAEVPRSASGAVAAVVRTIFAQDA